MLNSVAPPFLEIEAMNFVEREIISLVYLRRILCLPAPRTAEITQLVKGSDRHLIWQLWDAKVIKPENSRRGWDRQWIPAGGEG